MTAKVTVWPSRIEARIVETGKVISGPFGNTTSDSREPILGYVFEHLLQEGVEMIEIRQENTDD